MQPLVRKAQTWHLLHAQASNDALTLLMEPDQLICVVAPTSLPFSSFHTPREVCAMVPVSWACHCSSSPLVPPNLGSASQCPTQTATATAHERTSQAYSPLRAGCACSGQVRGSPEAAPERTGSTRGALSTDLHSSVHVRHTAFPGTALKTEKPPQHTAQHTAHPGH